MNTLPQIEPITKLQKAHTTILDSLKNGPVILTQHSKPTAVLVAAEEWNQTAKELNRLQRIIAGDKASAAVRKGDFYTEEEVDAMMQEPA